MVLLSVERYRELEQAGAPDRAVGGDLEGRVPRPPPPRGQGRAVADGAREGDRPVDRFAVSYPVKLSRRTARCVDGAGANHQDYRL